MKAKAVTAFAVGEMDALGVSVERLVPPSVDKHYDGMVLHTSFAEPIWLTLYERIQYKFGLVNAEYLQDKYYLNRMKLTARVVMQEPVGFITVDTLRKTRNPEWTAKRGQHAMLWTADEHPFRAIIPVYAGEAKPSGAVALSRLDHLLIALGLRTPVQCMLKSIHSKKRLKKS